ncbi:hypothetical protein LNQ82_07240 [Conchiformibius steedae DSM 2580]|uniref:Uncharacterized protein n=1 Tax=Conchiformibius steedae DSM 2580 TaxID=1121352 RepID=A0AAE9HXM3_9NEIS|nr:hypothetical protein [Conchiformibius steedae]QMT34218.1 hypothetical protein H3L98_04330 [Conchiformibius steedae]URD66991.1 hypothetical protein LNQ82_07240 [Conchiformibius steedae DSM 2580]
MGIVFGFILVLLLGIAIGYKFAQVSRQAEHQGLSREEIELFREWVRSTKNTTDR